MLHIQRKNSLLFEILVMVVGLYIMLYGMRLVSMVTTTVLASYINIIPLLISLWFIMKLLRIDRLIGKNAVTGFFIFVTLLTFASVLYSSIFVYSGYLNGRGELCAHSEHVWFYDNILSIARFSASDWSSGALAELHLGKYENLSVYGSLFLKYGGDLPTNMCIWSAFNLSLVSFLIVLSAKTVGVEDKKALWVVMLICLMQPYLDMIFACHRDGYGEVAIALGFYIFVRTYKNSTTSIIAFPFYAFLFWTFRAQYIIIAVIIFFWSILKGSRRSINFLIAAVVVALVVVVLIRSINIVDYAATEMYVGGYEGNIEVREGRSLLNMLLISTLGYFPWPNLLKDNLWPWQIFAVFQGAMNVAIIYQIFVNYKKRLSSLINRPEMFIGLLLIVASMVVPGHMSYTVVAMPFLAMSLSDVKIKSFMNTYMTAIVIIFLLGLIYSLLGLSGTRAFT